MPLTACCATLDEAERRGLIERDHERIAPTALGRRFLNDLLQIFLPEQATAQCALRSRVSGSQLERAARTMRRMCGQIAALINSEEITSEACRNCGSPVRWLRLAVAAARRRRRGYPSKIREVRRDLSPGGSSDVMARIIGAQLDGDVGPAGDRGVQAGRGRGDRDGVRGEAAG